MAERRTSLPVAAAGILLGIGLGGFVEAHGLGQVLNRDVDVEPLHRKLPWVRLLG